MQCVLWEVISILHHSVCIFNHDVQRAAKGATCQGLMNPELPGRRYLHEDCSVPGDDHPEFTLKNPIIGLLPQIPHSLRP